MITSFSVYNATTHGRVLTLSDITISTDPYMTISIPCVGYLYYLEGFLFCLLGTFTSVTLVIAGR